MPSKKYSEIQKRLKYAQQNIRSAIGESFVEPKNSTDFVSDETHKVAQGLYLIAAIFNNAACSFSLLVALTSNLTDINASVAAIQGDKNLSQDLPIPQIKDKVTFKLGLVAYEIFSALDSKVPGAQDFHWVLSKTDGWSEKVSRSPSVLASNLEEYLKQNPDEELTGLFLAIVKNAKSENDQEAGNLEALTVNVAEYAPEHQAQIDLKSLVVKHIAPWITYAVVGYLLDFPTTDLLVFCCLYCFQVYAFSNIEVKQQQFLLEDGDVEIEEQKISAELNTNLAANPQISFLSKEKILLISGICFAIGVVAFTLCLGVLLKDPAFAVFSVELSKEAINSLCIFGAMVGGASALLGTAGFTKACILDNFECSKTLNCC